MDTQVPCNVSPYNKNGFGVPVIAHITLYTEPAMRNMCSLRRASLTHIVETRALHNCVTEWVRPGHGLLLKLTGK